MASIFDFSELITNIMYVKIFGQAWILPLVLVFLIIIIISRNTRDFTVLFLPVYLCVRSIGFYVHYTLDYTFISLGAIMLILNVVSVQELGSVLSTPFRLGTAVATGDYQRFLTERRAKDLTSQKKIEEARQSGFVPYTKDPMRNATLIDHSNAQTFEDIDYDKVRSSSKYASLPTQKSDEEIIELAMKKDVYPTGKIIERLDVGRNILMGLPPNSPSSDKRIGYQERLAKRLKNKRISRIGKSKLQDYSTYKKQGPLKNTSEWGTILADLIQKQTNALQRNLSDAEVENLYKKVPNIIKLKKLKTY